VQGTVLILAYDVIAATWHGKERARLEALGKIPAFADGPIATIAAIYDLMLVTANSSDFQ
jgi:tRNA(fMet)-specific endonuclease VapC